MNDGTGHLDNPTGRPKPEQEAVFENLSARLENIVPLRGQTFAQKSIHLSPQQSRLFSGLTVSRADYRSEREKTRGDAPKYASMVILERRGEDFSNILYFPPNASSSFDCVSFARHTKYLTSENPDYGVPRSKEWFSRLDSFRFGKMQNPSGRQINNHHKVKQVADILAALHEDDFTQDPDDTLVDAIHASQEFITTATPLVTDIFQHSSEPSYGTFTPFTTAIGEGMEGSFREEDLIVSQISGPEGTRYDAILFQDEPDNTGTTYRHFIWDDEEGIVTKRTGGATSRQEAIAQLKNASPSEEVNYDLNQFTDKDSADLSDAFRRVLRKVKPS